MMSQEDLLLLGLAGISLFMGLIFLYSRLVIDPKLHKEYDEEMEKKRDKE